MRKQSIVTTEGFDKSYVLLREALKKMNISGAGGSIPTKTSDLVNDSGFVTKDDVSPKPSPVYTQFTDYSGSDQSIIDNGLSKGDTFNVEDFPSIAHLAAADFGDGLAFFDGASIFTLTAKEVNGETVVTVADVEAPNTEDVYYAEYYNTYWKFVETAEYDIVPAVICTGLHKEEVAGHVTTLERVNEEPVVVGTWNIGLNPSVYCVLDPITDTVDSYSLVLYSTYTQQYPFLDVCQCIGRFTAPVDGLNITLPADIHPAETNPSIKAGNTYEYNIFDGVFNLIDVTTE